MDSHQAPHPDNSMLEMEHAIGYSGRVSTHG